LVELTRPGRAGTTASRTPNLFRLTYRHTKREEPSHDWRRITTLQQATKLVRQARAPFRREKSKIRGGISPGASGENPTGPEVEKSTLQGEVEKSTLLSIFRGGCSGAGACSDLSQSVRTTVVGTGRTVVEVIHDADRCYGFLRRLGSAYQAWWSGKRFDDHFIGEFADKTLAIDAVVKAAASSPGAWSINQKKVWKSVSTGEHEDTLSKTFDAAKSSHAR
jgi:hypothetical protein